MALQEAAASALKSSPSPFSSLLRRSKFASLDTQIAQVYTTYGGDAHHGNWGLKRPLPLRRRRAYITLDAVDSRYQQTEWNYGQNEALFVKRFDELNVDLNYEEGKEWGMRMGTSAGNNWRVDSEFSPEPGFEASTGEERSFDGPHHKGPKSLSVPNIHSMSVGDFKRHLKKLHALRPKFKEYLNKQGLDDARVRGKSMYELAQTRTDHHAQFLGAVAASEFNRPASRSIEGIPHRSAGLVYTHISPMETHFSTKPQPGIVLHRSMWNDRANKRDRLLASFAGMVTTLSRGDVAPSERPLLDVTPGGTGIQKDDIESSVTHFRIKKAVSMIETPTVVGRKKQGLEAAKLAAMVVSAKKPDHGRSNPYTPGSREYVSMKQSALPKGLRYAPMSATDPSRHSRPLHEALRKSAEHSKSLLQMLDVLVPGRPQRS